jgi:L-threonylcarbamoyladenylate synthase
MTRRLLVDPDRPDPAVVAEAAGVIRRGELVAFPTETVYGLGANALDPAAAARIYEAKGRPSDNPLIVHVADPEGAEAVARVDDRARALFGAFWPGPLTLVLPALDPVPSVVRGGLSTVAVRCPAHPVALALIRASGVPIAAPSANTSGRPSPTEADAVDEDLGGRISVLLDGGPTSVGVESTVLDATGPTLVLLRPGGIPAESLAPFGELLLPASEEVRRRSPGTRYRHYAPRIPVLLWDPEVPDPAAEWGRLLSRVSPGGKVGYLGILPPPTEVDSAILAEDPRTYARILFAALRRIERSGAVVCLAQWPSSEGIGGAIRDRLARAAL